MYNGHSGQLQYSGLLNFGFFDNLSYQVRKVFFLVWTLEVEGRRVFKTCCNGPKRIHSRLTHLQYWEIPLIFIPMGIIGGLLGAFFVWVNVKVNRRYLRAQNYEC